MKYKEDIPNTEYWNKFEKGVEHHRATNLSRDTKKFQRFYIGDQWYGAKTGGEDVPVLNFIKPVGKYKISMIAQNLMAIVYSDMSGNEQTEQIVSALNTFATKQWETSKMDSLAWSIIKQSFVAGTSYLYCFNEWKGDKPSFKHRLVDTTKVYLSDEQEPDIQAQEYIIIQERISVKKAREIAEQNNIPKEQIELIISDEDKDLQDSKNKINEIKTDLGKCNSILYMEITSEGLKFLRSTEKVIYQPVNTVEGLSVYPVAAMRWEEQFNSARGVSGVKYMIPNQIEVNRTAARRAISVKRFAFPTLVVDKDKVSNIDDLQKVGAILKVEQLSNNPINTLISYLNPAPISADAERLQNEFITLTRELEGAGDAATGQIDPTKASGEAIKAARDQSAVPLNEQIASYKQFVEDLAIVWYNLLLAYSKNGIEINKNVNDEEFAINIPVAEIKSLNIDVRIDVTPVDPYSKLSQEIALERLFSSQAITFEEYVEALDKNSSVPKATLEKILQKRTQAQLKTAESFPPTQEIIQQQTQQPIPPDLLQGGMTDVMQGMQY